MTDKQFLIECIKAAYDKCNNTYCCECEYRGLGNETCELHLLADHLTQEGFFRLCDRSEG